MWHYRLVFTDETAIEGSEAATFFDATFWSWVVRLKAENKGREVKYILIFPDPDALTVVDVLDSMGLSKSADLIRGA